MKEKIVDQMTSLYPTSKTIRFKLEPIGKTLDYINKNGILRSDECKAKDYLKIKETIDSYHKYFINKQLRLVKNKAIDEEKTGAKSSLTNDIQSIYNIYNDLKKDRKNEEKRKLFLDKCTALRKKLVREAFPSEFKKKLTSGKLFSEILPDWVAQENTTRSNEKKLFWSDTFKRFSTYFTAFHENRENMYSDEDKSTAIAYRLINENLPRFF